MPVVIPQIRNILSGFPGVGFDRVGPGGAGEVGIAHIYDGKLSEIPRTVCIGELLPLPVGRIWGGPQVSDHISFGVVSEGFIIGEEPATFGPLIFLHH